MAPTRALKASDVAHLVGGELVGGTDAELTGVASLEDAGPGDLSFLASPTYLPYFQATNAGAVLIAPEFRALDTGPATRIVVPDPRAALRRVLDALARRDPAWGIAPSACIGRNVRWSGRVAIGTGAVLGPGVTLGTDCHIGAWAVIEAGATLGDACRVGPYALVSRDVVLGHRVVLQAGARVGTPGFAFASTDRGPVRIRHDGVCRLDDDVEVGANSTIDRGTVGSTVIGTGTKIDNLVQIAHNVRLGARCLVLAQAGIAGTSTVGDDVIIAGQAGLAGHLRVGDRARIAAQGGVIGNVAAGTTVSGYPARDHRSVLRQAAALARLTPLVPALERLAAREPHDA